MTVENLVSVLGLNPITLPDKDKEVSGAYIGDLLSWVMGKAMEGDAWITIMSNLNVVAVASLADVACVIFAEGVTPDEELIKVAKSKNVNLITSAYSTYETAVRISGILK